MTLPNVDTGTETPVQGTFAGAGQPVVATEDQEALVVPQDPTDESYSGLVDVQYSGSDRYTKDGVVFDANEVKTVSAEDARKLLSDGSNFKVV